jgi:glycosyltransferase involved in cell wall biosynthesis
MLRKKPIRVLFLPTNCAGVDYWRMYQFFECMSRKGIDVAIYKFSLNQMLVGEWEYRFAKKKEVRAEIYRLLKYCDVAVMGYLHSPQIIGVMRMFQEAKNPEVLQHTYGPKKILAEIDDWIIDTPDYNPAFEGGWKPGNPNERVTIEHLRYSNGIINSTPWLAKQHKKFNKKSYVIPNAIDFNKWNIPNNNGNKRLRIGWIGGGNHREDLRVLEKVVKEILRKYSNVEFYFAHGAPEYIKKLNKKYPGRCKYDVKWVTIDKYPEHLASLGFDIGLAPLDINKFNCGKSNLRWLEYSALRIPTVATDIESYKCIRQNKTGLLCKKSGDWIDSISRLIEDEKFRVKMGQDAYKQLKKEFNLEKVTDDYIRLLRRLL